MLAESQKTSTAINKLELGAGCGEKRPTHTNSDAQLPMENKEGVEVGQTSAPEYQWNVLSHPSIIRSADERQTRYAAALTCEGGGLDRFIARVDAVLDREMAEPSYFDHDSFAASKFAAGLGGGR